MRVLRPRAAILCVLTIISLATALPAADGEPLQFNRDIRPILSDNCFACHGPDARHRQAELRLDERDAAVKSGAIVPGSLTESLLVQRIRTADADELMPPPDSHKKLSEAQKRLLERWIEQGAEYQLHWAYERPVKLATPAGQHPIDFFVERELARHQLSFSAPADARTLARRLSIDLLGLPPTPQEVTDFTADKESNSYERLVDRLLSSPHYGERMAIGWLDVVRYADSCGYHSDNPRNVWPYRDWVVDSFNSNKRFDRFTLEQIAGDLLPDADQTSLIGSAFNRLLLSTEEGGAQPKDYEARMLTDRVRAIGTAWLGQTTGCAQCHDHKFDPFTTRDFYALGAFFADIKEPIVGRREDGMPLGTPEQMEQLKQLQGDVASAKQTLDADKQNTTAKDKLAKANVALKKFSDALPHCLITQRSTEKRIVRILPRGNWMDESGEVMQPALPHFLPQPKIADRELTRLDLAQWLISRDNPLTARTVMNRLWKQFFGAGLSRVLDDLGAQGEPPTHPQLLDWLACEFIDSGWDMKHMVRLIVTSRTYRQTSVASTELMALDPYNRLLARQSTFRIDAELVRDTSLAVSGLLVRRLGGPTVKPYQPEDYWENLNFPTREYEVDKNQNQYRRGLYIWWQRSFLHPSLLAFDAPSREECAADRTRSNIPQQALVLLNDPTYVEAARALATRILTECSDDTSLRLHWAWQQVLQREPTAAELQTLASLVEKHAKIYAGDPAAADKLLTTGLAPLPKSINKSELASWTHVARVLLNLHETITRS